PHRHAPSRRFARRAPLPPPRRAHPHLPLHPYRIRLLSSLFRLFFLFSQFITHHSSIITSSLPLSLCSLLFPFCFVILFPVHARPCQSVFVHPVHCVHPVHSLLFPSVPSVP